MLRLDNDSQEQPSLWESVLPPELFQMNEELTQVDKLLSDERFLTPFQAEVWYQYGPADHSRGHLSPYDVSEVPLSTGL